MTHQPGQAPPGWHAQPDGRERYWDGARWTDEYRSSQQPPPPTPPFGSQPGPYQPQGYSGSEPPKQKHTVRNLLLIVAGLFVLMVGCGVAVAVAGGGDEPEGTAATQSEEATPTQEGTPKDEPTADEEPTEEPTEERAVEVQAGQILAEFEGNEAAADAKYEGELVEVTGSVDKVDTELFDDDQYVIRLDDGGRFALLSVNCNDVTADVAAKVQVGSTITVLGTFDDGGDLGVEIKDCAVV